MFNKLDQPRVLEFVEKRSDVEIQDPVHSLAHDPDPQRIQRIMLTASGPESVTEAQKILFPYLVEDRFDRVLDDFVLQCRDSQRALPPVGFRNPDSSRRLRLIYSAMDSSMQVGQPCLQVSSILFPRHPIHPWRRLFLQAVITRSEQVDAYVVQQSRELQLPILPCCFAHTLQPAWPAFPARVRPRLGCRVFSLVCGLPSTTSAGDSSLLFGCFVGNMPQYDSPSPFKRDLPLIAFSLRPTVLRDGRRRGVPVLALEVSLHARGLRLRGTTAHSR